MERDGDWARPGAEITKAASREGRKNRFLMEGHDRKHPSMVAMEKRFLDPALTPLCPTSGWSEIGRSIAGDQTQNHGQHDGADHGDKDADNHSVLADSAVPEVAGDESADKCADQPHHHVHDEAESGALHQLAGDPAGDDADDDPRNQSMSHACSLLSGLMQSEVEGGSP